MRPNFRQRGYTSKWDKARGEHLKAHPWCVMCAATGVQTLACVVDHIVPHRGDGKLFWNRGNWQSLCNPHHVSAKQRDEARGYVSGVDVSGRPLDPQHPWNRR